MTIYVLMVFVILMFGIRQKNGGMSAKRYCTIICVMFSLVTGLRSGDVGSDTWVYYLSYEGLATINSLSEAITNHGDKGFYIFEWILVHAGFPFWVLTLIVDTFFYIAVTRLIYRYSSDYALSFLILMAFNIFQFSMTGIRQTAAMGFTLFALYEAYKTDFKLKKILAFIAVGYVFHNSCAVFLLIVPLLYMRTNFSNNLLKISIGLLIIGFLFRNQLMMLMLALGADSRFEGYEIVNAGAGFTTYLTYFVIYVVLLSQRVKYEHLSHRGGLDIWLMFLAVLFQGTVMVQSVMFRVAWYFSISLIIILPDLIRSFTGVNKSIVNTGIYGGILFMYFGITISSANVVPYKFFWQ